jgi:hypothetical protein
MSVFSRLGVSPPMPPHICCHVMHVFNHAITSSVFPSLGKVAIVRPVAKVGTPSGPSNCEISVVSILS